MCTHNPYKHQAKIEKEKKDYAYRSNALKFFNKETSWVRGDQRAATGLSRTQSDLYTRALAIQAQGRQLSQQAVAEYGQKQFVDEGGRSRTAGRNTYLALLAKQSQIESKINSTFGREMAHAQTGAVRQYQNKIAKNRQALGLPPEYGAPVMYRRQSLWERAQPIVDFASTVMTLGGTSLKKDGSTLFDMLSS